MTEDIKKCVQDLIAKASRADATGALHLSQAALNLANARLSLISGEPAAPSEVQIKHMVDRFLAWRLPQPWRPDGGINFAPSINAATGRPYDGTPTGTNLFDATQATAMVRHMIEGMT